MIYFFLSSSRKKKDNKKERLPSALFELFQHFSTLNKKLASLRQLFVFNAPKSTSALCSKNEAGHLGYNIASLVNVCVIFDYCSKTFTITSEAMLFSVSLISFGI